MSGWKSIIDINLKNISYGSQDHIWGVDPEGKIYKFSESQWKLIPGILKQISVGSDGSVWGVNDADEIFKRVEENWVKVDGKLTQISVGSQNQIWGVNKDDSIFMWQPSGWKHIDGKLRWVSVGNDGTVWGVDKSYRIWRWASGWKEIPGGLMQISVGSKSQVWGVNNQHNIYRYSGNDSSPWIRVLWKLGQISIGSDGVAWGIEDNIAYHYVEDCLLMISDPKLKEERIEQGDTAKYAFNVTNLSAGVIVENLRLELVFDKEEFTNDGVTITPAPPEKITVPGSLETGKPIEVEFTITADQTAKIRNYVITGIKATYTLTPTEQPDSIPIREWTSFEIVKD